MKKIKVKTLVASLLVIQTLAAQNPAISTVYSDREIVQMVEQYRSAKAHDVKPSSELKEKFRSDFPKALFAEWETANGIYEVEFFIRFREFEVLYDTKGNLLVVIEQIRSSVLPAVVKNAAQAKYPKYKFDDIYKIRRGTETVYKMEMEKGKMEVKLFVNSEGVVLEERFVY